MALRQLHVLHPHERRGYVQHQQSVARRALVGGEINAASAALRVLRPDDFAEPASASLLLEILRDPIANLPRRLEAAVALIFCDPRSGAV